MTYIIQKSKTIISKFRQDAYRHMDIQLHWLMSLVGGFLGSYAILLRDGNFGSAQTTNLIYLIFDMMRGDVIETILRMGAVVIYIATLLIATLVPIYFKSDFRRLCISIEIIGVVLVGFIPLEVNPLLAVYPIFAITALQWGTYSGASGYSSSTIFSTNNLKQTVISGAEYIRAGKDEEKKRFHFYAVTLFSYYLGAVLGFIAVVYKSSEGIWFCVLPLLLALIVVKKSEVM